MPTENVVLLFVLFPNLPRSTFRETYLWRKQNRWSGCTAEGGPHLSPSTRSHLPGINLPVPETLEHQAFGLPPPHICVSSFLSHRETPTPVSATPLTLKHPGTPALLYPGDSAPCIFPSGHWHSYSPFQFGEVSIIFPIFCIIPSSFFFPCEGFWSLPWVEA